MKLYTNILMRLVVVGIAVLFSCSAEADEPDPGRWTMWSEKPATRWRDAFVTGNGRHGTMVMGSPGKETITCVHEELFLPAWERDKVAVADVAGHLPEVRRLIRAGDPAGAANLAVGEVRKQLAPKGITNDGWPVVPHPAFDLDIHYEGLGEPSEYRRELNLETGEALSRWSDGIREVEQRVFSSQIDNVNVVELRATKGRKLNVALRLLERPGRVDPEKPKHRNVEMNGAFNSITTDAVPGWLFYHADYALDRRGYDGVARVTLKGGSVTREGDVLQIRDADRVLILVRIQLLEQGGTSQRESVQEELEKLPVSYASLLNSHARKHGDMFRRVTLDLGCAEKWHGESIEQLLVMASGKGTPGLYDLKLDPTEDNNVYDNPKYAPVITSLKDLRPKHGD